MRGVGTAPTEATCAGRTVRLKWHKLRRRRDDPPFARSNLRAGLAAGASLEVDIRALACGSFVCLHDPSLESETTGWGPVATVDATAVARLRMKASGAPPLMLDELVEIVRSGPTNPSALVQLDLYGVVSPAAENAFAAALAEVPHRFILGSRDWDSVVRLGAGVPGLALGYDPTDDAARATDIPHLVRERAPGADTIYLGRKVVRAAHERADPLVARLREGGHRVDCWTIDHGTSEDTRDFLAAVMTSCDQITTNTPAAWAGSGLIA